MALNILNTEVDLDGKTVLTAEDANTVSGLQTFDRGALQPFAVAAGAAKVANLDADLLDGIEGTALLKHDGSVAMTGDLDLGAVGQIKFPAVQNASADVNTLDDYEEGTWTPVIGGATSESGQTYSSQLGNYVKAGKLVTAYFDVTLSNKGTITGNLQIKGFPFAAAGGAPAAGVIAFWVTVTAYTNINFFVNATTQVGLIYAAAAAATSPAQIATADIGNTARFMGSVIYMASA